MPDHLEVGKHYFVRTRWARVAYLLRVDQELEDRYYLVTSLAWEDHPLNPPDRAVGRGTFLLGPTSEVTEITEEDFLCALVSR